MIISVVILAFVMLLFLLSPFRSFVFWLARPIWKIENALISHFDYSVRLFETKRSLVEENRRLQSDNNKLNYYILANDFLRRENDDLRENAGRNKELGNSLLASVLVKPGQTPYDQLIVDVGSNLGVSVGDLVTVEGSVVIGEITEVFSNTSKVELYSTHKRVLTVLIGPNSIQTEATGMGGGNFKVKLPKETDVKEGDSVVVPSISPTVFGVIEKIDSDSQNTFQDIYFKNPVNLNEIKFVSILKNSKK